MISKQSLLEILNLLANIYCNGKEVQVLIPKTHKKFLASVQKQKKLSNYHRISTNIELSNPKTIKRENNAFIDQLLPELNKIGSKYKEPQEKYGFTTVSVDKLKVTILISPQLSHLQSIRVLYHEIGHVINTLVISEVHNELLAEWWAMKTIIRDIDLIKRILKD